MTWTDASKWILERNFKWVGDFLDHFTAGYSPEEKAVFRKLAEAGEDEDEYVEYLSEDLYELGGSKRLAHVAVLLRNASIVETTIRNLHSRVLRDARVQGVLSVKREEKWRKDFSRAGLEALAEDLSIFTNAKGVSVRAKQLSGWEKVNDTRRLCNCFKHQGGEFKVGAGVTNSKDENRILQIARASAPDSEGVLHYHVPYEEIDVRDYMAASKGYCEGLVDATGQLLDGSQLTL